MLAGMDMHLITEHGAEGRPVGDLAGLLAGSDGFVWLDIPCCDDEAVGVLSEVFGFHPLAVKDCGERNRVPKMHAYPDCVFVVLHAPERGERGHVHYLELDQFIGANFLVTVHGPTNPAVPAAAALRETRAMLERVENGRLRPENPFALSHAIVAALTGESGGVRRAGHRRRVAPGATGHRRHVEGKALVADTADRFTRVRRIADGEREYLQGVIEFYQSILTIKATIIAQTQNDKIERLTEASYAQNEEVKKISAWEPVTPSGAADP